MEGKEVRFGMAASALFAASTTGTSTGAVELHPLLVHRARRRRADLQHGARRGRARRRRLRALRDAGPGHHHRVRRRPDGRAHPGVPGQEDRRPRDQARRALHPHHAGARAGRRRASRWRCPSPRQSILNPGPHGLSEVLYAFTSAANNNGSAFAGLVGEHRLLQHRARPGHARSAGSCRSCSCSALAGSLARQQPRPRDRRHPAHPPPAVRRRCSSASSSSSPA